MPTRKVSNLTKKKVASCQEWKCKSCSSLLDECFEIDHIICIKDGGSNEESNLQALCPNCHLLIFSGGCSSVCCSVRDYTDAALMFFTLSDDEISLSVKEAERMTNHFNSWLDGCGFAVMMIDPDRPVSVLLNGEVMSGRALGEEYAKDFHSFMKDGGVSSLVKCFDADNRRFLCGTMGSIWVDLVLEGEVKNEVKKKHCRVALYTSQDPRIEEGGVAWIRDKHSKHDKTLVRVEKIVDSDEGQFCVVSSLEEDERFEVSKSCLVAARTLDEDTKYCLSVDPTSDKSEIF